jgi:hypothetical protein
MEPDADEDYMGDLSRFLPPSPSSSPPKNLGRRKQPSTQAQAQPRAKRGKGVPWQERRRQEHERKQREEDARTMAGLAEAIPESNVGFRMLKQMGYNLDSRAGDGAEPVSIEIRRSRAGLGAEEPVLAVTPALAPVEKPREVSERERRQQEEMAAELREDSRNGLPEHLVRLGRPDLVAEQHHAALGVGERIHGHDEVRHELLHVDHVCGDDEIEAVRGG